MFLFELFVLMAACNVLQNVTAAPFTFDDDDEYSDPKLKKKHKNPKKPCTRNESERTFLPWHFSYVNVNYNFDCGGSNHQGPLQDVLSGVNKPGHHKPFSHRPHRPQHHNNKPSNVQNNKPEDVDHDPINDGTNGYQQKPNRPFFTFLQNHSQGMGILHTIVNGIFGSSTEKPSSMVIPVHEEQDDFEASVTPKWKPGQYITAYNPANGQYSQDISHFNSKQLYRNAMKLLNIF